MAIWKIKDWHGKISDFVDIEYKKNTKYEKIANNLMKNMKDQWDKASWLDLFNTKEIARNWFNYIISWILSNSEKKWKVLLDRNTSQLTPDWLDYVNLLLNESIEYYNWYLLRDTWNSFIKKWWGKKENKIKLKNTEEVRGFFSQSNIKNNSSADKQIHCSLLKIAYAINDIKINEDKINKTEKKFSEIKQEFFFPNFLDYIWVEATNSIKDNENNLRYIKLQTKCEISNKRNIHFSCAWRVKRKEQILVKEISDPKYNSINAIKDIYWIRNEVKTKEDALLLLEYLWIYVFKKKWEIVDKNIFWETSEESQDFIEEYANEIDKDFYDILYKSLWETLIKGWKHNKNYKDIKIRSKLWNYRCETQVNLVNNKNETGYAHHLIFDCKKKIRALCRLQWYTSKIIIDRYIKEAIEKDIEECKRYWETSTLVWFSWYDGQVENVQEEHIKLAQEKIFNYLLNEEQDILKIRIPNPNNKENIFTSRTIRDHFHKDWKYLSLYPKWSKAKNVKTQEWTEKAFS